MSPARPSTGSRRNPSNSFKPYTRGAVSMAISKSLPSGSSSDKSSPASARSPDSSPNRSFSSTGDFAHLERPGFPSYIQYKQVELSYLHSLTPRRQGKALISQAMFDRIWDVLHEPETPGETAQFRFWARKMFTVSKTHRMTLGPRASENDSPQEVLLHDGLLVAIQEQLYDLLCYCHGSTGHGGRDKTCALIRKHYTWVPKDLVASFIKACPTCIMKKCGNVDSAAALRIAQASASAIPMGKSVSAPAHIQMPALPAMPNMFQPGVFHPSGTILDQPLGNASSSQSFGNVLPWPLTGGPNDSPLSQQSLLADDPLEAAYREAILRARGIEGFPGYGPTSPPKGIHSLSMTREVSLFKGLPNGWQYRHEDFASAHAEFMQMPATEGNACETSLDARLHFRRPRVPSIVPLWAPNQSSPARIENFEAQNVSSAGPEAEHTSFPPMIDAAALNLVQFNEPGQQHDLQNSKATMQFLLMASEAQHKEVHEEDAFMGQIDPSLFAFCPPSETRPQPVNHSDAQSDAPEITNSIPTSPPPIRNKISTPPNTVASAAGYPSSTSIKRIAVPPRLNLDFPNERSFRALLAYRDSLGEGNLTPDSPLANMSGDGTEGRLWYADNDASPASSESSCGSQLSAFPIGEEISEGSTLTTPATSAVTTPVDECGVNGISSKVGKDEIGSPRDGTTEITKGKLMNVEKKEQEIESSLSDGMQVVCAL